MKIATLKHITLAALCLYTSPSLGSALASESLNPLIVTAGRMAENPGNISASVSLITRQDIEATQANTVAEILRNQAGIQVVRSGSAGATTSVFLRGANSGQTLVLIDGVRVGSATLGQFDWGNLATTDIESIEIVRGAQSSLYGADAMGGVIQIFTRKGGKTPLLQANVEAGTYSTKNIGASASGSTSDGSYMFNAEHFSTDGFSSAANGSEADASQRNTLSGHFAFKVAHMDAEVSLRRVDATTDLDGFDPLTFAFGDVLNYQTKNSQSLASVKITEDVSDTFSSTIQVARSIDDSKTSDPITAWNNSDFKTTIDQFSWLNTLDADARATAFGVDVFQSKGVSGSAGLDQQITQKAAFISTRESTSFADWNASVRYDANSVSNNKTTYKLGSAMHLGESFGLNLNYGTGFKAPSLNDLYFPDDGFGSKGNPNIKAETSQGWDAGLVYNNHSTSLPVSLSAVWFKQKYDNLIAWQQDPITFGYSPQNINQATTQGVEVAADIRGSWGFLSSNWTLLDARDNTSDLRLARRAKHTASLTLGTDFSGLHIQAQMRKVGQRFDNAKNTKVLDAYTTTDLMMSYAINPAWQIKGRVENLNDTSYEQVKGYGVAGRASYLGLSATF